ncbi:MAG: hypothetical protein WEA04_04865 [Candidatus Andersenbacteria bacterium]
MKVLAQTRTSQQYQKIVLRSIMLVILIVAQPFLWSMVAGVANRVHAQQSQKQQIIDVQARTAQIREINVSQKEFLDQLDVVVPLAGSLSQIIERLERLATDRQLRLSILDIKEDVLEEATDLENIPVQRFRISLQVTGTPAQLLTYIDAVEHVQELTILEDWSFVAATAPVSFPAPDAVYPYTATMSLLFFLQSEIDAVEE